MSTQIYPRNPPYPLNPPCPPNGPYPGSMGMFTNNPVRDFEELAERMASLDKDRERICSEYESLKAGFIFGALRDMKEPADFAPLFKVFDAATGKRGTRVPAMHEVVCDALDFNAGPSHADVYQILTDAANGQDVKARAISLIERMAEVWAGSQT